MDLEVTDPVIVALNTARAMELYAIHQFMNQRYALDDANYSVLAEELKKIAMGEMEHSELIAQRIKDLGGEPTSEASEKVIKNQDVRAIFSFNVHVERDTLDKYNMFIQVCRENGDNVSATLFENIINDEQKHYNYFYDVANHIAKLGDVYLVQMI
jgi:bacterioferritin